MRKIRTQAEIEKESRRNQMIIGGILIVLLVISTIGYGFLNKEDKKETSTEYNGVEFIKQNNGWHFEINGVDFLLQNLPQEVENISVSGGFNLQNYAEKTLYFAGDGSKEEILYNLGKYIERYQDACLKECEKNLPVKNCSDNLIVFEQGEETKVWQDRNCVYISGDYIKASDAFLYKIFGII